jgi:hypothetical protein
VLRRVGSSTSIPLCHAIGNRRLAIATAALRGDCWFGSVRFGSVRFGSVRFGSVRFGSVRFGSVRFGSVRFEVSCCLQSIVCVVWSWLVQCVPIEAWLVCNVLSLVGWLVGWLVREQAHCFGMCVD